MAKPRHVIIGNGPAGVTAAHVIRSLKESDEIVLIGDEPFVSYSRTLLPDFIIGRVSLDELWLYPGAHYREAGIDVRLKTRIVSVQPEKNLATTESGKSIPFDTLLLACGGQPQIPPIEGIADVGAITLKTITDAQNIIALAKRGSTVIVLGRDLVGVELTRAFSQMGLRVTYVEWGDELLPHIIDPATAEELAHKMKTAGVQVVVGEVIRGVEKVQNSVAVHTATKTLTADLLAVAIGKAPSLGWLRPSGIKTGSGIVVDERLRTNYPNVFAAGDAAEIYDPRTARRKLLFGWRNAVEQGRLAGANMCGDAQKFEVTYTPGVKQIFGVDIRHRWK